MLLAIVAYMYIGLAASTSMPKPAVTHMTDAVATASSRGDDNAPRKQTLLRLLDALHELNEVLGYGELSFSLHFI